METKDLEEYLGIVVDLEKNSYMQKKLIEDLRQKISLLGIPKQIIEPLSPPSPKLLSPLFYLLSVLVAGVAAFMW